MGDTVTIVVGSDESASTSGFTARAVAVRELEIDAQRLSDELEKLVRVIDRAQVSDASRYEVYEVQLNLSLRAGGRLAILGSGVDGAAETSVKVVIRRRSSEARRGPRESADA